MTENKEETFSALFVIETAQRLSYPVFVAHEFPAMIPECIEFLENWKGYIDERIQAIKDLRDAKNADE